MKKILSLLLCFLLTYSDASALRGGPSGSGSGSLMGQYSGILIENAGADVGLFLLTANISGPSDGQLVIFSQGPTSSAVFNCKLVGLVSKEGLLFGLFAGASGGSDNIAGQLTAKTIPGSSRLGGTASSQAGAGLLKTYLIDGWQTPESSGTLSL
jgi:hypothetical protein